MTKDLAAVILGPGIGDPKFIKYNQMWHISSEPLVVEPCSFLVPKASPIHASKIEITYFYKFMTNSSF